MFSCFLFLSVRVCSSATGSLSFSGLDFLHESRRNRVSPSVGEVSNERTASFLLRAAGRLRPYPLWVSVGPGDTEAQTPTQRLVVVPEGSHPPHAALAQPQASARSGVHAASRRSVPEGEARGSPPVPAAGAAAAVSAAPGTREVVPAPLPTFPQGGGGPSEAVRPPHFGVTVSFLNPCVPTTAQSLRPPVAAGSSLVLLASYERDF